MEQYVRLHRDKLQGNIMEFGDFCVFLRVPTQHMSEIRMHRMASMMSSSVRSDPQEPLDHYLPPLPQFPNLKNDVEYSVHDNTLWANGLQTGATPEELKFVQSLELMDDLYNGAPGAGGGGRHKFLHGMRMAQMAVKTNIREWVFIMAVRSGAVTDRADQTSRDTFGPLLKWFKENYPVFFEKVPTTPHKSGIIVEVMP